MGSVNVHEILVTPLKTMPSAGGNVLHAIKQNDLGFDKFGEAYFSWIEHGHIKAWKKHNQMIMNLIVPYGMVSFVFYSEISNEFRVIEIGEHNYSRITVPPGLWFGFKGLASSRSLVLNIANITHDPNEVSRRGVDEISFFGGSV